MAKLIFTSRYIRDAPVTGRQWCNCSAFPRFLKTDM